MLVRTVLVSHRAMPIGSIDVHDDGTVTYDDSGLERLVNNLATRDGVEADAAYVNNIHDRLSGSYTVSWISPEDPWQIGRYEPT